MTDKALMRELDFNFDDLAANREGRLSESQLDRLRQKRSRSMAIGFGVILVLAFVASLFIYSGTRGSGVMYIIGLGLAVCSAVIMSSFARQWLRLSADLRESIASPFSGKLERVVKPVNKRIATYLIRIGGGEFSVNKETFRAFAHEAKYTLYRAKYTGILFSAEKH